MVAPLLKGIGAAPALHCQRIALRPVGADEAVPEAVKAVGRKGGGHKLVGLLIEELIVDDAVLIAAARAVEGHLEVLVVNGYLMEGELRVGVDANPAGGPGGVLQDQIPQLHVLPPGD